MALVVSMRTVNVIVRLALYTAISFHLDLSSLYTLVDVSESLSAVGKMGGKFFAAVTLSILFVPITIVSPGLVVPRIVKLWKSFRDSNH